MQDVFALGDVAVLEKAHLPATARVANQEAKLPNKKLNKEDIQGLGKDSTSRIWVLWRIWGM